jgi:carbamoyl-phosphate synthase small subunit
VLHIRRHGAQQGVLSSTDLDPQSLIDKAKSAPSMVGRDLVGRVTSGIVYDWEDGEWEPGSGFKRLSPHDMRDRPRLIAVDYGIKRSILRRLTAAGFRVTVVPASAQASEILALGPDAIFLSNGPGDPAALPYARDTVAALLGKRPIFGICLGHQIIALALGAQTYKLEFGHHGANHPVLDVKTGRVEITSQNHGFAVRAASLGGRAELSHINLNDHTVEGLRGLGVPFFSVQYHPEASPGPHDANYLFRRLYRLTELFARYGAQALERLEAELATSSPRGA